MSYQALGPGYGALKALRSAAQRVIVALHGMEKSSQVKKVDEVQAALHAALKAKGFRKKSRTFNRTTEDGLTQVLNLQMGRHDPPGTVRIPGFRENLYGWFTVNLGVYVPEVARFYGTGEVTGFVLEPYCCVRARLGVLSGEQQDIWWRNDARADVIPDVLVRLERDGLPFLERFGSRDGILREWEHNSQSWGSGGPPRIVRAIILAERGDKAGAKELLEQQLCDPPNSGHPSFVRSLAGRIGIAID